MVQLARFIGEAPDLDSLIGFRGSALDLPRRLRGAGQGHQRRRRPSAADGPDQLHRLRALRAAAELDPADVDPALHRLRDRRRAAALALHRERAPARGRDVRDRDLPGARAAAVQRVARGPDVDHPRRRAVPGAAARRPAREAARARPRAGAAAADQGDRHRLRAAVRRRRAADHGPDAARARDPRGVRARPAAARRVPVAAAARDRQLAVVADLGLLRARRGRPVRRRAARDVRLRGRRLPAPEPGQRVHRQLPLAADDPGADHARDDRPPRGRRGCSARRRCWPAWPRSTPGRR